MEIYFYLIVDESYFRIEPPRPLFGDTVSVSCRMVAPEGFSFYRTEPEVAFDEDSKLQCSPSQIGVRAIEGVDTERFFAHRSPDGDRTNVSLVIEIRNFSAVDVGLKISCINKLHIQQNYRDRKIVLSGVLQNAGKYVHISYSTQLIVFMLLLFKLHHHLQPMSL